MCSAVIGEGPALMVPPHPVDPDESGRESLLAEAEPPDEPDGRRVPRLYVGLDPVQGQLLERVPDRQPDPFRQISAARMREEGRVPQDTPLVGAPHDP